MWCDYYYKIIQCSELEKLENTIIYIQGSKLVVHPFKTYSVNTKDFVLVLLYQVLTEDFLGANFN